MRNRRRIGGYVDVRALGAEGFTDLYSAKDPATGEPVLLRVCRAAAAQASRRFRAEATRAAEMRHPNITPILEVGATNGSVFVAEPARGGDLATLLERGELPPPVARLELLRQVAAALEHAHGRGLWHRDLKPSNVEILPGGEARVTAFGTGKLVSAHARLSERDGALPEAGYLPPELVEGRPPDARSDVFGFGLVAYELLTSQRAFPAATLTGLYRQLVGCDPVAIGDLWTRCPPGVAEMVDRCLERRPEARFADFSAVLAALEEARAALDRPETQAPHEHVTDVERRTTIAMSMPPGEPASEAGDAAAATSAADAPTVELTLGGKAATAPTPPPETTAAAEPAPLPEEAEPPSGPAEAPRPAATGAPAPPSEPVAAQAAAHGVAGEPAVARMAEDAAAPAAATPGAVERLRDLVGGSLERLRALPRRTWLIVAGAALGALAVAALVALLRGSGAPDESAVTPSEPGGGAAIATTAAAPRGRLVLDATPWAELTRLVDAAGNEVALSGERRTPVVLDLEPGSYQAFFSAPAGEEELSCAAEVTLEGAASCLVDAGRLTVDDYFKNLGWWR